MTKSTKTSIQMQRLGIVLIIIAIATLAFYIT